MQGKLLLRDGSEHHLKFRYLTILVATVLLLSIFTGCGEFGDESADKSGKSESTGDIDTTTGDEKINNDLNGNFIIPGLDERTDWNIELTFIECNETGIKIRICDRDNQGFAFNDLYFVLELYEDGEWVKISKMNENAASQNLGYVFPSETANFVDLDSMNRFAFLPDVELKTGRYKLTKILSGREFSVEFDLTFD